MNKKTSFIGRDLIFSSKDYSTNTPLTGYSHSLAELTNLNGIPAGQNVESVFRNGRLTTEPTTEDNSFMILKLGSTYYDGPSHHVAAPIPPYGGNE